MPRTDHTHVLVVHPNPGYGCNNLEYAPLFIHYGTKIDTTAVVSTAPPLHHWPLINGDLTNHGTASPAPAWAAPMTWTARTDGWNMANLTTQGACALGTTLDFTADFTLSFVLLRGEVATNSAGTMFSTGASSADAGSFIVGNGWCYFGGAVNVLSTPIECWTLHTQPTRITIVKKAAETTYLVYYNDQCIAEHSMGSTVLQKCTHFGKSASFAWLIANALSDIRFYNYCLTPDQVRTLSKNFVQG